jgi:branched-chain amino acid transport system ATP-binding protein
VEATDTGARLPVLTATAGVVHPPERPPPAPLELLDARAGYGRIEVLHGVSITVPRGRVAALLGPNGAGKTTALGVLSGLLRPTSGCRHVHGRHLNRAGADDLARIGICHVREGRSVFPNLSVDDNLQVAASCGASVDRLRDVAFSLFPRLGERRRQLAGTLSGGEKQMLALARGLGTDPSVLLIDELSMGLAPLVVAELYEAVAAVAATGVSVLLVEQFATIGLQHADLVYVMARGRVTYGGPKAGAEAAVQAAYLGSDG